VLSVASSASTTSAISWTSSTAITASNVYLNVNGAPYAQLKGSSGNIVVSGLTAGTAYALGIKEG
jgi:hypothetical protein